MASYILSLPFRRTHPVKLSTPIKQYISTKYDQHPDMFAQDMETIDRLRNDAVNILEPHVSGVRKIMAYAAQLASMGSKFPIDIGVDFTWYPALGFNTQRPVSENNLRFELSNVLYNLASLYSQLAVSQNRGNSDGLRSAANYFSQAAGVLAYIREQVIPDMRGSPPEDMDVMTLECLQQLLLAQSQECFWSKAVKDGMTDGTIAKLAAKVSDFYDQAAEFGTKSNIISTDWIHHMSAKHHHFAAAAQYRASRECLEKQNYGEEVTRLRDSLACANEALKESRWLNKIVLADLNALKGKVTEDLKRAEKDNDMIYLLPVPPKSELTSLGRAGMATARVPEEVSNPLSTLGDNGAFGRPVFAKLVPYAVHVAASIYEERKNRLVNTNIVDELENLTNRLKDLLSSLSLPASLQALDRPLGVPPRLNSHAEEIRQQDGLHRLRRSMHEVSKLKANDAAIYEEGVQLLTVEEAEDEQARLKHGTDRWNRQASRQAAEKLYSQVNELSGYIKSAANSDELVKTKLKDCEKYIRVLEGTTRDIEEFVPSSRRAAVPPNVGRAAAGLRGFLNDVGVLEGRRRKQVAAVREKARKDDINHVILAETARMEREFPMQKIEPAQFEDFFLERLGMYDSDRESIEVERSLQEDLAANLIAANQTFNEVRSGDNPNREREKALQQLENGYNKYKEIVSNVETGRVFYNDLAKIVTRFRDDCKYFAYQRRLEANQIENDLENAMSGLTLGQQAPSTMPQQRNNLYQIPQAHAPAPTANMLPPAQQPLPAPVPQRPAVQPPPASPTQAAPAQGPPTPGMWNPEMGIKFGSVTPVAQGAPQQSANTSGTGTGRGRTGPWDPSQGFRFV